MHRYRLRWFSLMLAASLLACGQRVSLTGDAAERLEPVAQRVERCLATAGPPLRTVHAPRLLPCVCTDTVPAGVRQSCHIGDGFVAFHPDGLPAGVFSGLREDSPSDHALAYIPVGDRPPSVLTEMLLQGSATLDTTPSTLGPRWRGVHICAGCD